MKKNILIFFTFLLPFCLMAQAEAPKTAQTQTIEQPLPHTPPQVKKSSTLDIKQVFSAAPIIYSMLFIMSVTALVIWLYSLITFRSKDLMPEAFLSKIREDLLDQKYDEALTYCQAENHLMAQIVGSGIKVRKHGPQVMVDTMKSEGKRSVAGYWQKLSLLNDIVIIAPMLGLLGTVIGMFYAFYDVNRSIESITSLFDGLGIAVGTTVVGLIVSIIAMVFATTLKYRIVKSLSLVENEAVSLSSMIEAKQQKAYSAKGLKD